MEDEEQELRNPYPSPPSNYTNHTSQNIALLAVLREREPDGDISAEKQREVLGDQAEVPDWPLTNLEPPRFDWIVEGGSWNVFGEIWNVQEHLQSLEEAGGQQLYPSDPNADKRPALLNVLRSSLVTYSSMLGALLLAPPSLTQNRGDELPEWQQQADWLGILAYNLMAGANDYRKAQARINVEEMMTRQLELRRAETRAIHEKCDSLEAQLAELRAMAKLIADKPPQDANTPLAEQTDVRVPLPELSLDDVLRWAEGI